MIKGGTSEPPLFNQKFKDYLIVWQQQIFELYAKI